MNRAVPGLTCVTCRSVLYSGEAKRTDAGWRHVDRNLCNSIRVKAENAEKRAARREDIEWMCETGETFSGVAKRLGITNTALEKWLRANDMRDVQQRLLARDPGAITHRRKAAA